MFMKRGPMPIGLTGPGAEGNRLLQFSPPMVWKEIAGWESADNALPTRAQ